MLLRLAGVARIGATCVDYPGTLLDVRHPYLERCHEVEQALSLADAMGHPLPSGDDGRLRIRRPRPDPTAEVCLPTEPYVVLHPGSSVAARSPDSNCCVRTRSTRACRGRHRPSAIVPITRCRSRPRVRRVERSRTS